MKEDPPQLVRMLRWKRAIDVAIVIMVSPALLLGALIATIVVGFSFGRPVMFQQSRIGLNEDLFKLLKFRTMTNMRDAEGALLPDAQRLTTAGKFLRKTSLDELPQVINVLRGEMSLVGPRPLLEEYLPYYHEHERIRHLVRPGITGLAQVSGRNGLPWDERLNLDAEYVKNVSLKGDAWILVRTVRQVLGRKDVSVVASESGERLDVTRSYPISNGFGLRRFEHRDIPIRVDWFANPVIRRHMSLPAGITIEGTETWLQKARLDRSRKDFVVYDLTSGAVVSLLGIRVREGRSLPEIYIMVDPTLQGEGIGTTSMKLLLAWLEKHSGYKGCWLSVARSNVPAIRMYERRGFKSVPNDDGRERVEMQILW